MRAGYFVAVRLAGCGAVTDLRERIAEALSEVIAGNHPAGVERIADAVMVEVQRDLDELGARVERKMARLRQAGEVIDVAEADAARLAEALAEAPIPWGRVRERLLSDEAVEAAVSAIEIVDDRICKETQGACVCAGERKQALAALAAAVDHAEKEER